MNERERSEVQSFAEALSQAEALLIGAGAGMGVDSGLPDFRGTSGFWKAYPPLAKLGIQFEEMANPLVQGIPRTGLGLLRTPAQSLSQNRPPPRILPSAQMDQRTKPVRFCLHIQRRRTFSTIRFRQGFGHRMPWLPPAPPMRESVRVRRFSAHPNLKVEVDEETLHALDPLPSCPGCGGLARPNILMFSDWEWGPPKNQRISHPTERMVGGKRKPQTLPNRARSRPEHTHRPNNLRTGMENLRRNAYANQPA